MTDIIFWLSVGLSAYTYFGYPVLLYILSGFRNSTVRRGQVQPRVTIIVTAHNEEQRIAEKLENTLVLEYPSEKREIIIASDGSTDRTNEIVSPYKDKGIILVASLERNGKEYAQWQAIRVATGEILIFSDVATILQKNALLHIVSNFNDSTVGCVSSEDRILPDNQRTGGEGLYVKYEMLIRRLESKVGSVVGLSGSFFAVRRELCQEWSTTLPSDFLTVIRSIKQGYRSVSDPTAVAFYKTVDTEKDEFQRKVRTVMRGLAVLMSHLDILNPFRYGFFSIELISHKMFRWLVPFYMACAFVANGLLAANHSLYRWLFVGQIAFYVIAFLGLLNKKLSRKIYFRLPAFVMLVNTSIAIAWIKYFSGKRAITWQPSKR